MNKQLKTNNISRIYEYLKISTLHKIREIYKVESEKAAKTKLSYTDYLLKLLEEQVLTKIERSINRKM